MRKQSGRKGIRLAHSQAKRLARDPLCSRVSKATPVETVLLTLCWARLPARWRSTFCTLPTRRRRFASKTGHCPRSQTSQAQARRIAAFEHANPGKRNMTRMHAEPLRYTCLAPCAVLSAHSLFLERLPGGGGNSQTKLLKNREMLERGGLSPAHPD